jgi:membrane-associated phospholipid phosphatase
MYDPQIRRFAQNHRSPALGFISQDIAQGFGDVYYGLSSMGALSLYGAISGNDEVCRFGLTGIKAFILTTATTQIAKSLFHRQRPHEGAFPDARRWYGPGIDRQHLSFFSGHTANAFALATVIAEYYDYNPWLSAGVYTLAGLTGFSRVYDDEHWASDVIVGAAIGYGIGRLCMNSKKWKPRVSPVYEPSGGSIGIRLQLPIH